MVPTPVFFPLFLFGFVGSSNLLQHQTSLSTQSDNEEIEITAKAPPIPTLEETSAVTSKYLQPFGLELHDFPQTGRGIRTSSNRNAGDVLLKVPLDDTIRFSNVKESLSSSSSSTSSHSLSMLEFGIEKKLPEEQLLALAILALRQENDEYVSKVLPKDHYSVWTLPSLL